jgi:hydroxymethylpyrimidine pyrophosphatase-like HAD family hydrolase
MLRLVGTGYIMENGHEELKKQLPNCQVIGHHHDNALAKKLMQL